MKKHITPILEAHELTTFYGENKVLDRLSFALFSEEILILMGANGAGKSTLLKALFGIVPLTHGSVTWQGNKLRLTPGKLVQQGMGFVPQDNRIFPEMDVRENILLGAFFLRDKVLIAERLEEVLRLFPKIRAKLKLKAHALSGGERQMLALARALMTEPQILFLDEPSVGLAPKLVGEVFAKIQEINAKLHTAIIIVEHNLKSLLPIAHRAMILANGKIVRSGKPEELLHSKVVEEVFFGKLA